MGKLLVRLALGAAPLRLCAATAPSFLQAATARGDWGEDDTEVQLCTLDAPSGSDRLVKVFADTADNTRYVSFAREGHIGDDGFIESMVKCRGAFPSGCLSSKCSECPCELDSRQSPYGNYQRRMMQLLAPRCQARLGGPPFSILIVGLGGGALAQHLLGQCPRGTAVDAVEYDPRMIDVATRFFGLPHEAALHVVQGDGGAVVAARARSGYVYDAILVDAYEGGPHVPESCRNATFVENLHHMLVKGGLALHNIKVDYQATIPLYRTYFGDNNVKGEDLFGNGEALSHLIVATA